MFVLYVILGINSSYRCPYIQCCNNTALLKLPFCGIRFQPNLLNVFYGVNLQRKRVIWNSS